MDYNESTNGSDQNDEEKNQSNGINNEKNENVKDNSDIKSHKKSPATKRKRKTSTGKRKWTKTEDRTDIEYDKLFAEHKHRFNMKCELCPTIFKTLADARTHYKSKHNNPDGHILCCNVKIKYAKNLVRHIETHVKTSQRDTIPCSVCQKLFCSKNSLGTHMRKKHGIIPNKMIDDEFIKFMAENFDMNCDRCDNVFHTFREMKQHQRVSHGDDNGYVKCKSCDAKLNKFHLLRDHVKTHLNPECFK